MAKTVRIMTRGNLTKGGFDASGVAVNDKVMVTGRIVCTSYTAAGEPLTAADLGLSTIDAVIFNVESLNDAATVPAAATIGHANYDRTGQRVIVLTTGTTPVTTGEDCVLRFVAFGDSGAVADLT